MLSYNTNDRRNCTETRVLALNAVHHVVSQTFKTETGRQTQTRVSDADAVQIKNRLDTGGSA